MGYEVTVYDNNRDLFPTLITSVGAVFYNTFKIKYAVFYNTST